MRVAALCGTASFFCVSSQLAVTLDACLSALRFKNNLHTHTQQFKCTKERKRPLQEKLFSFDFQVIWQHLLVNAVYVSVCVSVHFYCSHTIRKSCRCVVYVHGVCVVEEKRSTTTRDSCSCVLSVLLAAAQRIRLTAMLVAIVEFVG